MTPKSLIDAYAYQFSEKAVGIALFKGWFPIFSRLCADVDKELGDNKRDFFWVQVKEKFGAARFYYSMVVDVPSGDQEPGALTVASKIARLTTNAAFESAKHCIVCGAPAKIELHRMGGYQALCPEHADMVENRKKLPPFHCNPGDEPEGWWSYF